MYEDMSTKILNMFYFVILIISWSYCLFTGVMSLLRDDLWSTFKGARREVFVERLCERVKST